MQLLYMMIAVLLALVRTSIVVENEGRDTWRHKVTNMVGGIEKTAVMILIKKIDVALGREIFQYTCAGTIIHQEYVLTTAHCLDNVALDDILVVAGENDMTKIYNMTTMEVITNGDASSHKVKRIAIHPQYLESPELHLDIALLELKSRIVLDRNTELARLPPPGINAYNNKDVNEGGWGYARKLPTVKRFVKYPNIPNKFEVERDVDCTRIFEAKSINFSPGLELCANEKGKISGDGFYGGGLIYRGWEYPIILAIHTATSDGTKVYRKTEDVLSWIDMEANIRFYLSKIYCTGC